MRLWTGQLVLCLARTRTSATILLLLFLSTSPLPLVISTNQYLSKIFRRNRTKERKKEKEIGQYSTASLNATCTVNASQSVQEVFASKTLRTYTKHAHPQHTYVYTYEDFSASILFDVKLTDDTCWETICSPERNSREEGRKLYVFFNCTSARCAFIVQCFDQNAYIE